MSILVIGSFMMDQIILTKRVPNRGETIFGEKFSKIPGGKGANQAVAAARLGSRVKMAGMVGKDENGTEFLEVLGNEGIDTSSILVNDTHATGIGIVMTEDGGDNRIIVVPGANLIYSIDDLDRIKEDIKKAELLMLQLEMDQNVIDKAVEYASSYGVEVLLNPAPAREITDEVLSKVDYLTPNETELEILTGEKVDSLETAINASRILINKGVKNVIVTLGGNGSVLVNQDTVKHVEGFKVKAVNTVAAGDSFNGALATQIINGKSLEEALKYANAVGALTVTKEGAIPSLPTLDEVINFLNNNL